MNTGNNNPILLVWRLWNRSDRNIFNGTMVLDPNFREFLELLNKNDVRYLVVGGYAVAFHGNPRYTKDIDIWIWIDSSNVEHLIQVLDDFGMRSLGLRKEDFMDEGQIIQLGYPPARIDLLTSIDGVAFEQCYPERIDAEIEGLKVSFIDLENLRKNKKASGRHQDLADLEHLE